MSDEIQWDSSLVKKFGSSNHIKLLTQLKTEVKAFPLKRKNTNISSLNHDKTNKIHKPLNSNLEQTNPVSQVDVGLNPINNQQSHSTFKSKPNSFNNTNSSSNDLVKGNSTNSFLNNSNMNTEIEQKQNNIYNNNENIKKVRSNSDSNKLSSKVSFKETEFIE